MYCVHAGINRRIKSREKVLNRKQYMVFLIVCKMDALNFSVISHTTINHTSGTGVEETTKISAGRRKKLWREMHAQCQKGWIYLDMGLCVLLMTAAWGISSLEKFRWPLNSCNKSSSTVSRSSLTYTLFTVLWSSLSPLEMKNTLSYFIRKI